MERKRRKGAQRRWRTRRTRRRLAVAASLALAIGLIAWLVVRGGGHEGQKEFLVEPAPPFTLPTVAGEEFSLNDHLGRHNLLLYFNEGMG